VEADACEGEGGEVGGGSTREHERLEPLPGADTEVARPGATHVAGGGGATGRAGRMGRRRPRWCRGP
jgi:hypothetical protein